ncbi:probable rhamnogalacturonate lyase B [Argentina anserina]|uniref:probable rhamnogalacturonate lyase B n=1 Tax=Argentina anserina TaxID=57926 RepID=UPI00217668F5|nr:probable rhamnogalacturonate lyase B [Potentilla anserina]
MRKWGCLVGTLALLVLVFLLVGHGNNISTPSRKLMQSEDSVIQKDSGRYYGVKMMNTSDKMVLDNGLVQLTFSNPAGDITGIRYGGIDNLLEIHNKPTNRGYWDLTWNNPGDESRSSVFEGILGTEFRVVTASEDQVEVSFTRRYNASLPQGVTVPFNVDKRYILQRGRSGFYSYAIFERLEGWPEATVDQIRMAFKLQQAKFRYMALSDTRQRFMPTAYERGVYGIKLAYREAVLLNNTGEVDDKYQYTVEDKDNKLHGWICTDEKSPVGFWMITPSDEFRMAGPFKQCLTSHVGPTTLSVFVSSHYAGNVAMNFQQGEAWKKVFGPVFVYLNSAPPGSTDSTSILWKNAKQQMLEEVKSWPYNFTESQDFPSSDQRGSLSSRLLIHDKYINHQPLHSASFAYVGLAAPGLVGSWQRESKGYQFWTQADIKGHFIIKDVRPGTYSLYASVPGIIGDYKYEADITIEPGSKIQLPPFIYRPPRTGPTLWEIGIPDRTAAEFYIPDPYPTLTNKLYNVSERFRQYGLWERYADRYPDSDLVYKVGASNYSTDWFYAQVTRKIGNATYVGTTWQIQFDLDSVTHPRIFTLRLALASASNAKLQVRVNYFNINLPLFSTGKIGVDNAIARHGIHGLYSLFSVRVPSFLLRQRTNTIYLTQSKGGSPFTGIMYDYIRLEGPPF